MCESTVYTTNGTKIMEDVINMKINELLSLNNYFKYSYELKNGLYKIITEKEKVFLIIENKKINKNRNIWLKLM